MRELTQEEKQALKEKIHAAGLDKRRSGTGQIELTDSNKEEMKKMIARAEKQRLEQLDKRMHSRNKKEKKRKEHSIGG